MTRSIHERSDSFGRVFSAVAMAGPVALIAIASALSEGLARGQLVVFGCIGITLALGVALALRTAYGLGFRKAFELAVSKQNLEIGPEQAA